MDGLDWRLRGSRRGCRHGPHLPRRYSEGREQSHPWNFKPIQSSLACKKSPETLGACKCRNANLHAQTWAALKRSCSRGRGRREELRLQGPPHRAAAPAQRNVGRGRAVIPRWEPWGLLFRGLFSSFWLFPRTLGFASQAVHSFCHLLLQARSNPALSRREPPDTFQVLPSLPAPARGRFSSYFLSKADTPHLQVGIFPFQPSLLANKT